MSKSSRTHRLTVCLLSPHPLVLGEFQRLLSSGQFRMILRQPETLMGADLRRLKLPRASVYVMDSYAARPATGALISKILDLSPAAKVIVVGETFTDATSFPLLRMGVRGLLTYLQAKDQLPDALKKVAAGGLWVPRTVLAGFVDSILSSVQGRRLRHNTELSLSRREEEVLDSLLENLANKEIASRLNISERTVKFHVSNLLAKFGVQRRADLILLCYQRNATAR